MHSTPMKGSRKHVAWFDFIKWFAGEVTADGSNKHSGKWCALRQHWRIRPRHVFPQGQPSTLQDSLSLLGHTKSRFPTQSAHMYLDANHLVFLENIPPTKVLSKFERVSSTIRLLNRTWALDEVSRWFALLAQTVSTSTVADRLTPVRALWWFFL